MINLSDVENKLKTNGRYWIAFVGDSITSCEWVHPNWREIVEYVLKDKFNYDWGIKTFNFAYDGSTSKDLVNKKEELKLLNPDLVVLLTGANDPFHGVAANQFKENINEIKKYVESLGSKFALSTDTCPNDMWAEKEMLDYIKSFSELDNNFINLFEISKSFPSDRIYTFISEIDIPEEHVIKGKQDFWHPNQLGNAYIAKVILKEIFNIEFDPEKYWQDTLNGEKLPRY